MLTVLSAITAVVLGRFVSSTKPYNKATIDGVMSSMIAEIGSGLLGAELIGLISM